MKKAEQKAINEKVETVYNRFVSLWNDNNVKVSTARRFRSCSAEVRYVSGFIVLQSYNTVVAVIDENGDCYDFLRLVYGYTATSAQHVSKFRRDYAPYGNVYTWRYVG